MTDIGAAVDDKEILGRQSEMGGLLAAEDMLPLISGWQAEGLRTALVTLVTINGRDAESLAVTGRAIRAETGADVIEIVGDMTNPADIERLPI